MYNIDTLIVASLLQLDIDSAQDCSVGVTQLSQSTTHLETPPYNLRQSIECLFTNMLIIKINVTAIEFHENTYHVIIIIT